MTTIRQERVSSLLFEELTILVGTELADPRLRLISVTGVEASRDLRSVRVYIHNQDETISTREALTGLRNAAPFLRRQIAQRVNLRVVPELHFVYDDTPERAERIDQLLRTIAAQRAPEENDAAPPQQPPA